jgi:hypothetical protein
MKPGGCDVNSLRATGLNSTVKDLQQSDFPDRHP